MDKLIKSASVWESLENYSFIITYSKKGKLKEIPIVFDRDDFFHLAGFQYANDISLYKTSKEKIIECIHNGKITLSQLEKSQNYNEKIETRLNSLCILNEVLNHSFKLYRFDTKGYNFHTDIEAEYFIYDEVTGCSVFFFVRADKITSLFHGISTFEKGRNDYCMNKRPLTVVKKEKLNLLTNEREEMYRNRNLPI